MDKIEARAILATWLAQFRSESYESIVARIDEEPVTEEIVKGDVTYQLEANFFWDDKQGGDVRVIADISDTASFWSSVSPLCDDFIKAPDGSFVDE